MGTTDRLRIGLNEVASNHVDGDHAQAAWLTTALGPPEARPEALRVILSTVLAWPAPMILAWGPELTFIPNPAVVVELGPLAANGVGRPLRTILADGWPRFEPLVAEALAGRGSKDAAVQLALERGGAVQESWWDLACAPVRDGTGTVSGLICLLRETTSAVLQKRTREHAAENLRAALAAGDKIGSWDWDVVNNVVKADTTFALFYCVDPELAQRGVPVGEYMKCMHPDDRPVTQARIEAAVRTGETFYSEYRLIGPGGEIHWIAAQGQPELDSQGRCVRFPGISFDITLRKLREARQGAT